MGLLTIKDSRLAGMTLLVDDFIDYYMPRANGDFVKIYLYLLRMMSAGLTTSISDIADKFNHTEKDVVRALKYWEKCRLLSLEYDDAKNLSGIQLLDPSRKAGGEIVSLAPVV